MTRYAVVGFDGSGASVAAVRWAAAEAVTRELALRIVTVVPAVPLGTASVPSGKRRHVTEITLDGVVRDHPGLDVVTREIPGEPAQVLNEIGHGAEVLVLGTRGAGGFAGLRVGAVALGVASGAPCSVVLVPVPVLAAARVPEVVVGVDARNPDGKALGAAFDAARLREVRLRAMHAWHLPPAYEDALLTAVEEDRAEWEDAEALLLDDALRGWREKYPGVAVLPDVRLLGPADALVRASADAGLLVVGRGPRHSSGLGSVAHAVAHHSACPLLLAPRH
ncbi:universal stress protein [Streptomyces sp. NBC_01476]|uniref:universal stress protein n=1 Tax=Streptomyces sp. NBC_01476 TaxID=2903881 RepID=UPI002E34CFCA|nr:universal stress protein [Streptomyces sp. NBC_01476]